MTAPQPNSYSVASGEVMRVGRYPAWRKNMPSNTWLAIPASNTIDDLNPADDPLLNSNHPATPIWGQPQANVIDAWCGGCFAEESSEIWIPFGGGHNDYAGNEIYKIRIDVDVPVWEMTREPSGTIANPIVLDDGQEATGLHSDGQPRSCHTYNGVSWAKGIGCVVVPQGSVYKVGNGSEVCHIVDKKTSNLIATVAGHSSGNGTAAQAGSCYDETRHAIWKRGKGTANYQKLDLYTNGWTNVGTSTTVGGDVSLVHIPGHDVIVHATQDPSESINVLDCVTGLITTPTITGAMVGATIGGAGQWRYVESLNALAKWDNSTDTTIINLLNIPANPRTDTWTITQLTVDGANAVTPSIRTLHGTFGRFFYSEKLNGFGVINSTNEPIYFFAL